jgi:hypothetical protein
MKNMVLALCLALASSSAYAQVDLNQYIMVSGGFGLDGATGEPTPNANSAVQAKKVFHGLTATAVQGTKSVQVAAGSHEFGIESEDDEFAFALIVEKSQLSRMGGMNKTLTFRGKVAGELFRVLPANSSTPVGSETRTVANVSCTRVSAPSMPASCTIKNLNFVGFSLRQVVDSGEMTETEAQKIVADLGF